MRIAHLLIGAAMIAGASASLASAQDTTITTPPSESDQTTPTGEQEDKPRSIKELTAILRSTDKADQVEGAVTELQAMVSAGDADAAEVLATEYSKERGSLPVNIAEAVRYYEIAANLGRPQAYLALAGLHSKELGGLDKQKALDYYKAAADAGLSDAYTPLARAYQVGTYGEPDLQQAITYYQKAADLGDMRAVAQLVSLYRKGTGAADDGAMMAKYLQLQGESGDTNALLTLADLYLKGRGVPQDMAKSEEYWRKASDAGDSTATAALGSALMRGQLGEGREPEGLDLLNQAYQNGNVDVAPALADAYLDGRGTEADPGKALDILQTASNGGNDSAKTQLFSLYVNGSGSALAPDPTAARNLLASIPDDQRSGAIEADAALLAVTVAPVQLDQMWMAFSKTDNNRRATVGRKIFAANKNAYVYLLQGVANERGYYNGRMDGMLTPSTIIAVNQLCNELDISNICRLGPMKRSTWDAIAEKAFAQ